MSTFSVDGLVSGLDTTTLIRQLMQVEGIPKQRLQVRANEQAADVTAYQSLSSVLKKLDDAAAALTAPGAWGGATASTTGDAATATARAGAAAARYDLTVSQLAAPRTWTSDQAYSLDDVVASGAIDVTTADGTLVSVQPASGSLRDVLAAVNGAEGLGVTAVAVRVSDSGYRLQIVSSATGADQGQLAVAGLDVPLTQVAGRDALFTVNGLDGRSSGNTVGDLVPGLDVTFTRVGTAVATVAPDRNRTIDAIEALVEAANDALAAVRTQTLTDPTASTRGPLASDSLVRGLSGRIVQAVTDALGGAGASSFGLQSTRDGGLVLDTDRLSDALATDMDAVRAVLAPADGGIVARLRAVVTSATDAGTGFITSAVQGRETTRRDLLGQIESWDRRLAVRQATLQRQFAGLEVALGSLRSQSTFLAGQLAGLQTNAPRS